MRSSWPPAPSSRAAAPPSRRASGAAITTTACRSSSSPAARLEAPQWPFVTYVSDVRTAMTRAKEAAGDRNVIVHGAGTAQLALAAGVLDELEIHVIPVLLGEGPAGCSRNLPPVPSTSNSSAPGSCTGRTVSPTCATGSGAKRVIGATRPRPRACASRAPRAARARRARGARRARDDRERVVERGAERRRVQAVRVVRRARVRAGQVGVADPGGDEPQRDVLELHLHLGLQADAERLRALGELPADRVVVGGLGVVEDERRRREPLDRRGLAGCARGSALT